MRLSVSVTAGLSVINNCGEAERGDVVALTIAGGMRGRTGTAAQTDSSSSTMGTPGLGAAGARLRGAKRLILPRRRAENSVSLTEMFVTSPEHGSNALRQRHHRFLEDFTQLRRGRRKQARTPKGEQILSTSRAACRTEDGQRQRKEEAPLEMVVGEAGRPALGLCHASLHGWDRHHLVRDHRQALEPRGWEAWRRCARGPSPQRVAASLIAASRRCLRRRRAVDRGLPSAAAF